MNYYKVMSNGVVIDANFVFLKWQKKNRVMLGCDISEANFIQSSDQNEIWRVPWLNPVDEEVGTYETVDAVEITEEEYLSIREALDEGTEVPVPEPEEPDTDENEGNTEEKETTPEETVMSVAEMRRKIVELEEALKEQTERNDFLEGCLLEMSEIVYD